MNLLTEDHVLECRGVSYMSTVNGTESFLSRLYRPPVVAQFLKEVSLTARSGEIHGILGVSGSGKTTLLEVIATRALGDIGGTVVLDKHLLTASRFSKLCVFVSSRVHYPPRLHLRALFRYHALLSLGGDYTKDEIEKAIHHVLESFDLLGYVEDRIGRLSESARRRAVLALQLLSDPLLVVVDDILRDMDPLPSFQLVSCLSTWARRNNRIVLVTMRTPRSDIYQLLNRITILYYGEVFYTGFTKKLPAYFKEAGFPCPTTENPAVYYLSLATVDRETSERYQQTQEQAVKLVDRFRVHAVTPSEADAHKTTFGLGLPIGSSVALSYLERPGPLSKMWTLTRRTVTLSFVHWPLLVLRLLLLPILLFAILGVLVFQPTRISPSLPYSASGVVHLAIVASSLTAVFLARSTLSPIRTLCYIETAEDMYNGGLAIAAHLVVEVPIEILSSLLACTLWLGGPNSVLWTESSPMISSLVASSFPFILLSSACSHFVTLITMAMIRSPLLSVFVPLTIVSTAIVLAGGFLRHRHPFTPLASALAFLNPHRHLSHGLATLLVPQLAPDRLLNCTRNERQVVDLSSFREFCRWPSSSSYLVEVFPSGDPSTAPASPPPPPYPPSFPLPDFLLTLTIILCSAVIAILVYTVPKPRVIVDKFRYK